MVRKRSTDCSPGAQLETEIGCVDANRVAQQALLAESDRDLVWSIDALPPAEYNKPYVVDFQVTHKDTAKQDQIVLQIIASIDLAGLQVTNRQSSSRPTFLLFRRCWSIATANLVMFRFVALPTPASRRDL